MLGKKGGKSPKEKRDDSDEARGQEGTGHLGKGEPSHALSGIAEG